MKLCLFQIFFTVIASLGLQSRADDDNVNGLSVILVVWLLLTPCAAPLLHLLSEVDVSAAAKRLFKATRRFGTRTVAIEESGVEA